jgi:hypothetical protein
MHAEFQERGVTYEVKHYVKRIPEICTRIKEVAKDINPVSIEQTVMHCVQTLMLDDLEIINWVKFIERFELEANSLGACLLFIGMATKLLMNNLR